MRCSTPPFVAGALAVLPLVPVAQTPLTSELVAEGLLAPVHATAPKGDDRVFICEQAGVIQVAVGGALLPTPFLDIQSKISPLLGESGLLGMAFHPKYEENGYFYVHYTGVSTDSIVERYTVSAGDPNVADAGSATVLLTVPRPTLFHNGGAIQFGPFDDMLYVGIGDGGTLGPECNAQDTASLLGKIIRIDVDGGFPYAIPPDNPFAGDPTKAEEIWHYGLRNPWRFGIDRVNGAMYIGDVGASDWEEIDYAKQNAKGLNYGWPLEEGNHCFEFHNCQPPFTPCGDPSYKIPIYETTHLQSPFPCAMVGGYVYQGCAIPDLQGKYFFSDYCNGNIYSFRYNAALSLVSAFQEHTQDLAPFFPQSQFVTSFGEDGDGELLFVYHVTPEFDGKVYRVVPASPPGILVDCDGDGLHDPCEISFDVTLDLDMDGQLDACQSLSADGIAVSATAGGEVNFSLHAGSAFGGRLFLLAGSTTGTSGFPIGLVTIPLTFDLYTNFAIVHAGAPPLVNNTGFLNASGEGSCSFSAGPGLIPTSLIGTQAYHAYALLDPLGLVDFASNFVTLFFEL